MIRIPPPILPGDRIGVVAPAGPPNARLLRQGARWLERRGYLVEMGDGARSPQGYLAAPDRDRLRDLNRMLRRPEIAAIWFARGGYGSARLLEGIDFAAARKQPKRWIGYSDVTALQIALLRSTGIVSFYGPMVVELGQQPASFHLASLERALDGGPYPLLRFSPGKVVRPGRGAGQLVGGCLSLLCSLLGTPFEPDLDGKILFWEEVGEEPFRLDRYLFQLRLAGKFRRLRGMLVGRLVDCEPRNRRRALPVREILSDVSEGCRFPVVLGLPFGHARGRWTLPVGYRAAIDTGRGAVRITAP